MSCSESSAFVDSGFKLMSSMSLKKKRKSLPAFANCPKKAKKRKNVLKSYNKDWADALAASDKGSYLE